MFHRLAQENHSTLITSTIWRQCNIYENHAVNIIYFSQHLALPWRRQPPCDASTTESSYPSQPPALLCFGRGTGRSSPTATQRSSASRWWSETRDGLRRKQTARAARSTSTPRRPLCSSTHYKHIHLLKLTNLTTSCGCQYSAHVHWNSIFKSVPENSSFIVFKSLHRNFSAWPAKLFH